MADFPVPLAPKQGVVMLPPSAIHASIRKEAERLVAELPKDRGFMASVSITLEGGTNLALAYRRPIDPANPRKWDWQIGAYIGTEKSFTTNPTGGFYAQIIG